MNSTDPNIKLNRTPTQKTYPKKCNSCGMLFNNHAEFLNNTTEINKGSLGQGPKETVLVYRNCKCGSTITAKVTDLRDYSEEGIARRDEFRKRLSEYEKQGMDKKNAIELVKKEMNLN